MSYKSWLGVWIGIGLGLLAGCQMQTNSTGNQNGSTDTTNGNTSNGNTSNGNPQGDGGTIDPNADGHIAYRIESQGVFVLAAQAGATPVNVSTALNAISPGADLSINIAPDGQWLVLATERFDPDCAGAACLAVVPIALTSGEVIKSNGMPLNDFEGQAAIASGGNLVVYSAGGGPHTRDLFAVRRSGGAWSDPALLTSASTFDFNAQPAVSADGTHILYDCGNQPFAAEGTAICEVGTDAAGWRQVLTPADSPSGLPKTGALHHPDYAPGGGIVFEADWTGERIWSLPTGGSPTLISSDFPDDNSPCVLPNGKIVSLWLNRPGNAAGLHEIKVMNADGTAEQVVLQNQDVLDIGIGCGK